MRKTFPAIIADMVLYFLVNRLNVSFQIPHFESGETALVARKVFDFEMNVVDVTLEVIVVGANPTAMRTVGHASRVAVSVNNVPLQMLGTSKRFAAMFAIV